LNTYLFVVDATQYDASVVDRRRGGRSSSCKDTTVGDRVLVYVSRGDGISYEWTVTAPAEKDPKWRFMCGVGGCENLFHLSGFRR
jgi:hypothetical protein